jgi:hypothetical protein
VKLTTLPYRLASFQGTMITLVVEGDDHMVVTLSNRVSFIHAKVWAREAFEADYKPAKLVEDGLATVLRQFKGYAKSIGMTAEAAVYLPKLIPMTAAEIQSSLTLGLETHARIKKEALRMEQQDNGKDLPSGKAPRKLGGAAAAAVKRKEERLAAEAKKLAEAVSKDLTETEKAGAADARLPKTAVKRSAGKGKPPKITKETPPADLAKKIVKGKANSQAQVKPDSGFDPSKLKGADGEYKSASSMFKGLLYEGKLSDDKIAAAVDKKFGLGDQKAKDYVKWNRGWFRRQGIEIAAAK